MQECSLFSTPSPAFIVSRFFDDAHSNWCEVIPHCSFDLHFSNNSKYHFWLLNLFSHRGERSLQFCFSVTDRIHKVSLDLLWSVGSTLLYSLAQKIRSTAFWQFVMPDSPQSLLLQRLGLSTWVRDAHAVCSSLVLKCSTPSPQQHTVFPAIYSLYPYLWWFPQAVKQSKVCQEKCPHLSATLHFLHRSFSEYFWSTCSGWGKVFGSEGVGPWHWIILNIVSKHLRKEGLLLSGLVSLFIPKLGAKSVSESKCSSLSLPIFFVAICLSVILGIQCYLRCPGMYFSIHLHQGGR